MTAASSRDYRDLWGMFYVEIYDLVLGINGNGRVCDRDGLQSTINEYCLINDEMTIY
jgi:hypothetical protein